MPTSLAVGETVYIYSALCLSFVVELRKVSVPCSGLEESGKYVSGEQELFWAFPGGSHGRRNLRSSGGDCPKSPVAFRGIFCPPVLEGSVCLLSGHGLDCCY